MEKEVPESERKIAVKKKYVDKINYLVSKPLVEPEELYSLVRGFFAEFLKLEYEFTYEELTVELNKILIKPSLKSEIDEFLYDLSECEYLLDKDIEQAEIRDFLVRIQYIIRDVLLEEKLLMRKTSFLEKIFKKQDSLNAVQPPGIMMKMPMSTSISDEASNSDSSKIFDEYSNEEERILESMDSEQEKSTNPALMPKAAVEPPILRKSYDKTNTEKQSMTESSPDKASDVNFNASSNSLFISDKDNALNISKEDLSDVASENAKMKKQMFTKTIKLEEEKPKKSTEKIPEIKTGKKETMSKSEVKDSKKKIEKIDAAPGLSNMPLTESDDPSLIKVYELMEQSYYSLFNNRLEEAKIRYLNALDLYHKLDVEEKKTIYLDLFDLFKRLKNS